MRWMRFALMLTVLVAGCGMETEPGREKEKRSAPAPAGDPDEWVAVIATGEPDDLEDETAELMQEAPGDFAVSPVECWPGLDERLGEQSGPYVAALVAPTREELDELVRRTGRDPIAEGRYPSACLD